MFLTIVWLVVGLVLILVGANALTDGSSSIASRLGVSDMMVGLTVVAFGTSAPELSISVISALHGSAPLAVGNVVGSNIFNVLAIVGITAMIRPLGVEKSVMTTEIPIMIVASLILLALGNSSVLNGSGANVVSRIDGMFLLLAFALFMRNTFTRAKVEMKELRSEPDAPAPTKLMPVWKSIVWVIGGLAGLVWGGDRFVEGASGIARTMGVSEAVIGLTIVAAGTSLPELATSIVAAVKGKPGLAIGNVVGSNIFNILMVLGLTSIVSPLPFTGIGNVDLLTMVGSAVLFWIFGWIINTRTITRGEGVVLTACYVGYMVWIVSGAMG